MLRALFLFSAKPSSALHRQYLDFCTRHSTMSGHVSLYGRLPDRRVELLDGNVVRLQLYIRPVLQANNLLAPMDSADPILIYSVASRTDDTFRFDGSRSDQLAISSSQPYETQNRC